MSPLKGDYPYESIPGLISHSCETRNSLKILFFLGNHALPRTLLLLLLTLIRAETSLKPGQAETLSVLSYNVWEGFCLAPPADSGTVSHRAQKYLAESLQWAEAFIRWKDFSSLLNSASKPLMPFTRVGPDKYFSRTWRPWLGYWTYQKRLIDPP